MLNLPSRFFLWLPLYALAIAGPLWASTAAASPVYGYYLISYFDFTPGCSGCHNNPEGGAGTVTQPFGLTMRGLGLTGNNDYELLIATLNALGDTDTDGDTAKDADEVMFGGDPNDPAITPPSFTPVMPAAMPPAGTGTAAMPPAPTGATAPGQAFPDMPSDPPESDACSVNLTNAHGTGGPPILLAAVFIAAGVLLRRRRS